MRPTDDMSPKQREHFKDVRNVATYLLTARSGNMIGLYYIPIALICYETGLTTEEVERAIDTLGTPLEGDLRSFLVYERATQTVFVRTMATRQLRLKPGQKLKPGDNNRKAIVKLMRECPSDRLLEAFYEEYAGQFDLPDRWWTNPIQTPSGPPYEGVGRQGQKTEDRDRGLASSAEPPLARAHTSDSNEGDGDTEGADEVEGGLKLVPPKPKEPKGPARRTQLPKGWHPTEEHKRLALEEGRDWEREAIKFKDHALAERKVRADWDAAFRNWLRNEKGRAPPRGAVQMRSAQVDPDWEPTIDPERRKALEEG